MKNRTRLALEIHEQPEVVARLVTREAARVFRLTRALTDREFVLIVARGTSDNAARFAQYAFGIAAGLPVALAAPSITTLYGARLRLSKALVIGISQSGRSPDVVETLAAARRAGAATIALVNDEASPLVAAASEVVPLGAGEETSVAATKTYTAELAAVVLLAAGLARKQSLVRGLERIPEAMALALAVEPRVAKVAAGLAGTEGAVVVARGVNFATAFELALKLKETALLLAEPYSAADFLHGPVALARRGLLGIVLSPPGARAAVELESLAVRLAAQGAGVLRIGPSGHNRIPVPEVPELFSPLVAILPGQLLALHLALARGLDPDAPPGLRKITETR